MPRFRAAILVAACLTAVGSLKAQEQPPSNQPQVRINYLNVCTPPDLDQKEMATDLGTVPVRPAFATDFEVSRGRSTVTQPADATNPGGPEKATISRWVRIRHEITSGPFSNAQYSFSVDETGMTETLVFRARDLSRSVLQISLQDSISAGTPDAVLASNTPVDRIRIERNGKSSLVLARCAETDQSKYEPLFRAGSELLAKYRTLLRVRQTVPADLARVTEATGPKKRTGVKH